jgi:hypothetical protein
MILAIFNTSGDVAFTVLGAVVVSGITAWVTAHTTNKRLDKQLAAERRRVELQLDAEESRQRDQLHHDRQLSDLAELRSLLDEASRLISKAVKTSAQISANWIRQAESPNAKERLEGQMQYLRNETVDIVECHQRIMLRLPRDSVISVALNSVRDRIARLLELAHQESIADSSDARFMEEGRGSRDLADAHVAFLDAARTLVGSQLPEEA